MNAATARLEVRRWVVEHRVDSPALLPGRVAVTGTAPAARLAWQLAQLGAVVQIRPTVGGGRCGSCGALLYTNGTCPNCDRRHHVDACRRCARPDEVHCPGCRACWPGYACSLLCDLEPEELDAAIQRVEDWQEQHDPTLRPSR